MTETNPYRPDWLTRLDLSRFSLHPGATQNAVDQAEKSMGYFLPRDYREFLLLSDGASLKVRKGELMFFPVESSGREELGFDGIIEYQSVAKDEDEWPLLAIGQHPWTQEDIGFLKRDLHQRNDPL